LAKCGERPGSATKWHLCIIVAGPKGRVIGTIANLVTRTRGDKGVVSG
jgi:hypothetical protein